MALGCAARLATDQSLCVRQSPRTTRRKSSRLRKKKSSLSSSIFVDELAVKLFGYTVKDVKGALEINSNDLACMATPDAYLNDSCIDLFINCLLYTSPSPRDRG